MFWNKKPVPITFITHIPGFEKETGLYPQPYKSFMPAWWDSLPNKLSNGEGTIKRCAGIIDLFSQAYVLPMWMDATINLDDMQQETPIFEEYRYGFQGWDEHPSSQLLDYTDLFVGDRKVTHTLKAVSPWSLIVPKGYSILQLPVFFHFEENYSVVPGMVDSDIFHQTNVPLFIHNKDNNLVFKKGDPFVMYIPIKRTKFKHFVSGTQNDKNYQKLLHHAQEFFNNDRNKNPYRKLQKDRDSGILNKKSKVDWFEENA